MCNIPGKIKIDPMSATSSSRSSVISRLNKYKKTFDSHDLGPSQQLEDYGRTMVSISVVHVNSLEIGEANRYSDWSPFIELLCQLTLKYLTMIKRRSGNELKLMFDARDVYTHMTFRGVLNKSVCLREEAWTRSFRNRIWYEQALMSWK